MVKFRPFLKFEKIQTLEILIDIILIHTIWRFQICNYFREIFKFRDFMRAFTIFVKYINVDKIAKFINNIFEIFRSGALK